MKLPASVITTLVLFVLFILVGILTIVKNYTGDFAIILVGLPMPTLFVVACVGIFLKKNWARIYSTVLIALFGTSMLVLPLANMTEQNSKNEMIIFVVVLFGFFVWWAYSLFFGKASINYFSVVNDK